MNTVAATSSVITAALTAAFADGPIVNTPWFLSRIAGELPMPSTTSRPIESSPMSEKPAHGISPPNSSAWAVR